VSDAALPGSIQYLDAKVQAQLDDLEQRFINIARAQATELERVVTLLGDTTRQRDELQSMVVQAERERDRARETAQLQAKSIAEYSAGLQRLRLDLAAARADVERLRCEYEPGYPPAGDARLKERG
jgi:cell division septum initiation protein DivIVA